MGDDARQLLSARDVQAITGLSRSESYRLMHELRHVRRRKRILVPREELQRYLARGGDADLGEMQREINRLQEENRRLTARSCGGESEHARQQRAAWNWDCAAVLLAIAELQRVRYLIDDDERAERLRTISIRARDALDRIKHEPQWAADEGRANGYVMGLRRAAEVLSEEASRGRFAGRGREAEALAAEIEAEALGEPELAQVPDESRAGAELRCTQSPQNEE